MHEHNFITHIHEEDRKNEIASFDDARLSKCHLLKDDLILKFVYLLFLILAIYKLVLRFATVNVKVLSDPLGN